MIQHKVTRNNQHLGLIFSEEGEQTGLVIKKRKGKKYYRE